MIQIHVYIIVLSFFIFLLIHHFFVNDIEGLDGGECSNNSIELSNTNSKNISELQEKIKNIKGIKIRVDNLDNKLKKNKESLKEIAESLNNAGKAALGGFASDLK